MGRVGEAVGIQSTLIIGAIGLLIAGLVMHRVKLPAGDADLVPSNHWPEPLVAEPIAHDRGPVLILIEYKVEKQHRTAFLHAIDHLSRERRRDGAYGWGITEDSADPEKIVEWFMVESWAEHLRQHKRVSNADADLQGKVLAYHVGPDKPVVRHFLTINDRVPRNGSRVAAAAATLPDDLEKWGDDSHLRLITQFNDCLQ